MKPSFLSSMIGRTIKSQFVQPTMQDPNTFPSFPSLPMTNLENAEFTATDKAFRGETTIIDFWTTKCVRCPDALDQLNELASDSRYKNVKFASICCDSCDRARNIIDEEEVPRWGNISHYFMDQEHKEEAKKILGFKAVPFYVVLNENGAIVQMGSKKQIDFENVPGMVHPQVEEPALVTETKEDRTLVLDEDF